MSLPIDFVASATALECYESCPRRFQHRYLFHSPTAGPDAAAAQRMQRGELFHRLVLWHDLGLETDQVLRNAADPVLEEQWTAFQTFMHGPGLAGAVVQHDQSLVARCAGFPILAEIDALVCEPGGGVTIYDWKTSERPSRTRLIESQQTRVYPYVVWEVMRHRDELALSDPEQIRLIYWFPSQPNEPFEIEYSTERMLAGAGWLDDMLTTMAADTTFAMTSDLTRCQGCEYVAHCGVKPEGETPSYLDEDYYLSGIPEPDSSFDHPVSPD